MGRSGELALPGTRRRFSAAVGQLVDERSPVELAIPDIDFRHGFLKLVHISLREASHYHEMSYSVAAFQFAELEDHIYRFLLGVVDKAAGVHDHIFSVRLFGVVAHFVAACRKPSEQPLGID